MVPVSFRCRWALSRFRHRVEDVCKNVPRRGNLPERRSRQASNKASPGWKKGGTDSVTQRYDQLFRELYDRFYEDVVRLLMRNGADKELARDLAQETFVRVYRGLKGYRGDGHRTWIWTIAKRQWSNWLRSRATIKRAAEETSLDARQAERTKKVMAPWLPRTASPGEQALWNERVERLNHAVRSLSPKLRRYCLLCFRDGLSYKEIAAVMNVSTDTVKSQVRAVRDRLRDQIGEIRFEEPDDE